MSSAERRGGSRPVAHQLVVGEPPGSRRRRDPIEGGLLLRGQQVRDGGPEAERRVVDVGRPLEPLVDRSVAHERAPAEVGGDVPVVHQRHANPRAVRAERLSLAGRRRHPTGLVPQRHHVVLERAEEGQLTEIGQQAGGQRLLVAAGAHLHGEAVRGRAGHRAGADDPGELTRAVVGGPELTEDREADADHLQAPQPEDGRGTTDVHDGLARRVEGRVRHLQDARHEGRVPHGHGRDIERTGVRVVAQAHEVHGDAGNGGQVLEQTRIERLGGCGGHGGNWGSGQKAPGPIGHIRPESRTASVAVQQLSDTRVTGSSKPLSWRRPAGSKVSSGTRSAMSGVARSSHGTARSPMRDARLTIGP